MTAISEETYKAIGKPKLQTLDRILNGPAKQALDVLGQFTTTVSHISTVPKRMCLLFVALR